MKNFGFFFIAGLYLGGCQISIGKNLQPVGKDKFLKFNLININTLKIVQEIIIKSTGIKYKISKNTGNNMSGYRIWIRLNKDLSKILLLCRNNPESLKKHMSNKDEEDFINGLFHSSGITGFYYDNNPFFYLRSKLSEKHLNLIKEILKKKVFDINIKWKNNTRNEIILEIKSNLNINLPKFRRYTSSSETICGTEPIKKVVAYCIFGDGSLVKTSKNSAQLKMEHCSRQKEWLLYKVNNLEEIFNSKTLRYRENRNTFGIQSISSNLLGSLRKEFYPNDQKKLSKLLPYLDEKALAWWFMDDGNYEPYKNGYRISIYESKWEIDLIKSTLEEKFNLFTNYYIYKKTICGLIFGANRRTREKFIKIISPYIIPSMIYKFGRGFDDIVQSEVSEF